MHESASGDVLVKEEVCAIKVKKRFIVHFLHDTLFKGIFVQLAYDVSGVVCVLRGGPQSSMGTIDFDRHCAREFQNFPEYPD